ncbi:hypothetical protein LZ32DRAFT_599056 [Colletotrichum eremochloae]|nr:hypothetical protein LZ32DRAFT_599056 [Colletotrichum eremochloae]
MRASSVRAVAVQVCVAQHRLSSCNVLLVLSVCIPTATSMQAQPSSSRNQPIFIGPLPQLESGSVAVPRSTKALIPFGDGMLFGTR